MKEQKFMIEITSEIIATNDICAYISSYYYNDNIFVAFYNRESDKKTIPVIAVAGGLDNNETPFFYCKSIYQQSFLANIKELGALSESKYYDWIKVPYTKMITLNEVVLQAPIDFDKILEIIEKDQKVLIELNFVMGKQEIKDKKKTDNITSLIN